MNAPAFPVTDDLDGLPRSRFYALLGPLRTYLDDAEVQNVNVNADGRIWVGRSGGRRGAAVETMPEQRRCALVQALANREERSINRLQSRLQCEMPYYDARVQAFAPPVSPWTIMIRRHAPRVYSLDDYVAQGVLTHEQRAFLSEAIAREANILIGGAMGSGKTTFLNACMHEAARLRPLDRCIIIQDRLELKASAPDHLMILARVEQGRYHDGKIEKYAYEFSDALEDALRTDGQYIVWGELRDGRSAAGLVSALNTGARGIMTTVHADNARESLRRIETLLREAGRLPDREAIAEFVRVVVFLRYDRDTGKRMVDEIVQVAGIDEGGRYRLEPPVW